MLFKDFSDIEFAKLLIVVEKYDIPCFDLIKELEEYNVPVKLVSELVNTQRYEYGLNYENHTDYKSILLDKVVSGKDYCFKCENLRLVLSSLVVTIKYDKTGSIFSDVVKLVKRGEKFLSFKIDYKYNTKKYVDTFNSL